MNLEEAKKKIKGLLIKEAKKIFRYYHIDITKYKLEIMGNVYIDSYETANQTYNGTISRIVFASKNKTWRKKGKNIIHKDNAKIAIGALSFKYCDNKLYLLQFKLGFN